MSNKVALITGGAMGYKKNGPSIGGAIALQLAKDGYSVVVFDRLDNGQTTVDQIINRGGQAIFIKGDATNTEEVKNAINQVKEKFGGLHCLVNCVARYDSEMMKNVAEIKEEWWNNILEVNLNGYFKFCKYAIPAILESGGGTIINISSIESYVALPNFSVYSVSKAAVDALTRTIAVDFAPKIRANSICPGFVRIENSENKRTPKELEKWYSKIAKTYPMKRVAEVEDIANIASFLASDKSSYINGQTIIADGGYLIADKHKF